MDRNNYVRLALAGATLSLIALYLSRLRRKVRLGAVIWSKTWFTELSTMWPGQAFSLQIERELYDKQSKYQHVQVFDCGKTWGKVLALDGVIQVTEKDECAYQEMMAHVPLSSHPNPKRVLVVGGGDGGVLREIAKHSSVEEIHICELDEDVIKVSKLFLPSLACGYDDPRVVVHIADGFEYIKNHKSAFDVIIVDSSDPVGPAEVLFQEPFYKACSEALRDTGIMCCQGECIWLHFDVIKGLIDINSKLFAKAEYAYISIPSYPCGTIGLLCCSKSEKFTCSDPSPPPKLLGDGLKYYNRAIHKSSFVLPTFAKKILY